MYIDPNTGGMIFQVLATILALFSGILLLFSSKIRAAFARMRRSTRKEVDENGQAVENPPPDAIIQEPTDDKSPKSG